MRFDFSGKIAIVTGGTRGIGRCIAELLVESGADVIYTGTKTYPEQALKQGKYEQLDLMNDQSVSQFTERAIARMSQIDILINNAGINVNESIGEISDEHWDSIIKINLTGAMKILRSVARNMIKSGNRGKIVNISSIWGVISKPKRDAYSAAKTGLIGLTKASALDLAPYGILVNALCPGFVNTELTRRMLLPEEMQKLATEVPLGRFAEVDEVACAAAFLCSGLNTYITGQTIVVDGGFTVR